MCNLPNTRLDELFFFSTNFANQIGNFCKVPVCNFLNTMWHITVAINCTKKPVHYTIMVMCSQVESVYKQATDLNKINENR